MNEAEKSSVLVFYVNGKRVEDDNVNPEWTLLYYLRNKLHLCGAKLGCAEGGCGACTVMVSKYDRENDKISHIPVNACLAPVCTMHGLAVTTVEGIGSTKTKLHPVQERIAKAHGSQCGFCTPGIVMSMYTLLRNTAKPSMKNLDEIFQGNLCRCTGYRPIIEAYKTFTTDYEIINSQRSGCCKGSKDGCQKKEIGSRGRSGCCKGNTDVRQNEEIGNSQGSECCEGNKDVCQKDGIRNIGGTNEGCCKRNKDVDQKDGRKNIEATNKGCCKGNNEAYKGISNEFCKGNESSQKIGSQHLQSFEENESSFQKNVTQHSHISKGSKSECEKNAGKQLQSCKGYAAICNQNNATQQRQICKENKESGNQKNATQELQSCKGNAAIDNQNNATQQHQSCKENEESGKRKNATQELKSCKDNASNSFQINPHSSKESESACQKENIENTPCCKKESVYGEVCCKSKNRCCEQNASKPDELFEASKFVPFDPSQEPIFPPELKLDSRLDRQNLHFKSDFLRWHRPNTLKELVELKSKHPEAKIVVGNTEIGVEVKFKNQNYPILIQPGFIREMNGFEILQDGIKIGACCSLDSLNDFFNNLDLPEDKIRVFLEIRKMLNYFAGKQIRSVASIGGNIMTGSPISDLNPILMAAEVDLYIQSLSTQIIVKFNEHFYTGYRRNILKQDEVLVAVKIPFTQTNQFFKAYKQARRRDDDIAIVNAAFNFVLSEDLTITHARLVFGGVAPTTKSAVKTSNLLKGKKWDEAILNTINSSLLQELHLPGDAPGGMVEYRKTLPLSFFYKTYVYITLQLQGLKKAGAFVSEGEKSALADFGYKPPKSAQFFQIASPEQKTLDPVGRPVIHSSALKQATGEAVYFDDIPHLRNELYLAFVYTAKSHALIKSIDFSKALKLKGVVGYISAQDVKEGKKLGPVHQDEELFIRELVTAQNQLIAAVVAKDELLARKAARLVEVQYQELQPVVVSIEDAIKHGSFFDVERKLSLGDVEAGFREADHVLEGECRTGYQEHFYLETHGCLVVPKEGDYEIFSSSQHHCEITDFVSRTLEIPQNRIVTRIKRIGGGFGGKQSRGAPITVATALAAKKFNRPVRIMFDRNEDMASTGGRHPYYIKYKVGFKKDGQIIAYDAQLFANGGYSSDLSVEVLERAVFHIENSYKLPNIRVVGKICKTNLPTNTAFRGFGAPQSMFAAENMIRDVAEFLEKDPVTIALAHLYKEGDITHYNQQVENCNLKRCVEECLQMSKYNERKQEIEAYNKNNRWKKRGISLVSTKYGVGFGVPMLEQAGALVNIYTDGSVLITQSGVEMGQGLNIKMIQVASRVLEIPTDNIYISECATDKVPNTSPTAASVGSDLNGMAVMRACQTLKDRLKPVVSKNPEGQWKDWIMAAYLGRISLSATGYYATPDIEYNWDTNSGKPYNYYTYGASCTEVEIDCLTGDHQVLRTDIVMDIGNSLNPAIDIGQIEGGFMQGYGLFVMEEMVYSPSGTIYSKGPGAYKIPGFNDIPIELNVSLLKGVSNPRAVYSSKAVGEPPLFLASSALFAIREAVKYARADAGKPISFRLNAPATAEKIRMACEDSITDSASKSKDSCTPWNVIP